MFMNGALTDYLRKDMCRDASMSMFIRPYCLRDQPTQKLCKNV